MHRVALVNPNTNDATTQAMLAIARAHAGDALAIEGLTAATGARLITSEDQLAVAACAVEALVPSLGSGLAGVIVAAFGDPGLAFLRAHLSIPVAGIGEAAMLEAAAGGRRFAIATTTAGLGAATERKIADLGLSHRYVGSLATPGDPVALTASPALLEAALAEAIAAAIATLHAEAVIIGGGPLAVAARALAPRFGVPIIEPIPAAVDWLRARLGGAG